MKLLSGVLLTLFVMAGAACAQQTHFQHIVLIIQENRTPDNLFYALCSTQPCSTTQQANTYDIQTSNWLDKNASGGVIQPTPSPLDAAYSPSHSHPAFVAMCDLNTQTGACAMDGAGNITCKNCPANAEFEYVDDSQHIIDPYLFIATHYGWANYMFQTNQGPSFPAHQFLFGGTSAPSRYDDHNGTFIAENLQDHNLRVNTQVVNGCIAKPTAKIQLIDADGQEKRSNRIYPCVEHQTLGDLLDKHSLTWRYYTPDAGNLWSAPDAINHICVPEQGVCTGAMWQADVALNPRDVLTDVANCNLRNVSWVIPSGQYSDHSDANTGLGPSWVASVVNAIGNSSCRNSDNSSYWDSTAIIVTWDDWGGWYDHEPPTFLPYPEGGYQYGFRVPMLFLSAYTPKAYINNERLDFGAAARFIEYNFGIPMGKLTFADARSTNNLGSFYNLSNTARPFEPVPAPPFTWGLGPVKAKLEPPDDD
jgi:phospholipase C